jgi:voltage-gated sodium channel
VNTAPVQPETGARHSVRRVIESARIEKAITALIILNAITLGLDTVPWVVARMGRVLHVFDLAVLGIFVVELLARLFVHGGRFFRNPWHVFDLVVVVMGLMPAGSAFTVLRALRVLRVLRLVSLVPSMRSVVEALLSALPGMASIIGLLALVIYVAAVMATKLFGGMAPEYFGSLGASLFTLFQVMTVEGWPDIARSVMEKAPHAWIFFALYLLVATFMVLNLFIAVVVNAMQSQVSQDLKEDGDEHTRVMLEEIRALRREIESMRTPSKG